MQNFLISYMPIGYQNHILALERYLRARLAARQPFSCRVSHGSRLGRVSIVFFFPILAKNCSPKIDSLNAGRIQTPANALDKQSETDRVSVSDCKQCSCQPFGIIQSEKSDTYKRAASMHDQMCV